MVISCLYVQTVIRQCFCFPNSQWGATAHNNVNKQTKMGNTCKNEKQQCEDIRNVLLASYMHDLSLTKSMNIVKTFL